MIEAIELLGVILAIGGNLISSVSYQVQKTATTRAARQGVPYTKLVLWWSGLLLMGIGEAGNFVAFAWAPATVVSPLGVVSVLANAVLAYIYFHERMTWREILGVVVVLAGATLVVVFAPPDSTDVQYLSIPTLVKNYFGQAPFLIYFSLLCIALAAVLVIAFRFPKIANKNPLTYIAICALLGAYTVMTSKAIASLVRGTATGHSNCFSTALFYAIVLICGGSVTIQIIFLNKALFMFRSSQVVPLYYCMFTVSSILAGALLFNEMYDQTEMALSLSMFFVGLILIFGGVWLITRRAPQDDGSKASTDKSLLEPLHNKDDAESGTGILGTGTGSTEDRKEAEGPVHPFLPTSPPGPVHTTPAPSGRVTDATAPVPSAPATGDTFAMMSSDDVFRPMSPPRFVPKSFRPTDLPEAPASQSPGPGSEPGLLAADGQTLAPGRPHGDAPAPDAGAPGPATAPPPPVQAPAGPSASPPVAESSLVPVAITSTPL